MEKIERKARALFIHKTTRFDDTRREKEDVLRRERAREREREREREGFRDLCFSRGREKEHIFCTRTR